MYAIITYQRKRKRAEKGRKWKNRGANSSDMEIIDDTSSPKEANKLTKEQKKKWKRAKNLLNVGEISKAMAAILSNGVADVNDEVL